MEYFFFKGEQLGALEEHLGFQHDPHWQPFSAPKITEADGLVEQAAIDCQQAVAAQDIHHLAVAMISTYGWQLANGAAALPNLGELAKMHHPRGPLYLWRMKTCSKTDGQ